ncbi:hypothetical protein ISCGN_014128 [Ixodes scapularis]
MSEAIVRRRTSNRPLAPASGPEKADFMIPKRFRLVNIATIGVVILLFIALAAMLLTSRRSPVRQPHIVFILADDLGWNDVSYNGCPQIRTPNIDALAWNGIRLQRYYTQPMCTPSRAALMTGRYPIHTGMQHFVILQNEPRGLPLKFKLLPQWLGDLGYVSQMLGKNLQWRKQNSVDTILEDFEPTEVLKKYYPGGLVGHDKEGCPLWIIPFGYTDIKGLFYSVKKSDFIKHIIQQLEFSQQDMSAQTEALGKVIEMHSFIFDLENFNLKQIAWKPALDMIINLVTMYEDNYPEMLKKAYVINAPKIYPIIYNMVKPFLSEETAKKIHVFGKDNWKKALLQDISEEELPVHWGGTKAGPDGDPRCTHIVFPSPGEGSALGTGKAGKATRERGTVFGGQAHTVFGSGKEHDVRGCEMIRGKRRPGDAILEASSSSKSQPPSFCWTTAMESPMMPLRLQFE